MFCSKDLKRPVSGLKTETDRKEKVLVLVKDLQKTVSSCKKLLHTLVDGLVGIEEKSKSVEKKVKGLEKERSRKLPGFEEFSKLWSALVEKKNKKKKQKKKRKRRRSEEEVEQKKKKIREESK